LMRIGDVVVVMMSKSRIFLIPAASTATSSPSLHPFPVVLQF
jgi:hypothetical protein